MAARFLISAPASGSGKTLVTCGILQALKNKGMTLSSFKCGPDYIDPMFHSRVLGTKSRNLDTFFTDPDTTRWLLAENSKDCTLAVMEGVMGFYDGVAGTTTRASAWELADVTDTPVVLVVNGKGMSLSLVSLIKGFLEYKEKSHIKGIILNRISPMLYPRMKAVIEEQLSVKVVGYIPEIVDCVLESRHLGLILPDEVAQLQEKLQEFAAVLEKSIDWSTLIAIAKQAPELSEEMPKQLQTLWKNEIQHAPKYKIAVASDEAFCFFYEDNFRLLEKLGAELIWFSPLHDSALPEQIDGLLLSGGYPELYARQLSENVSMRASIQAALRDGMPCIAECGGFLYLHRELEDMEHRFWPMANVIDAAAVRTKQLRRFGYITLQEGEVFGEQVGAIRAHEFHYFDSEKCGEAFLAQKPESTRNWRCIHSTEHLLTGFPHFYYFANPAVPKAFLKACDGYRQAYHMDTKRR